MHKLIRLFISTKDCVNVAHFIIDLPGCRLIKPNRALTSIKVNGVRATLVEWLLPRGIYYLLTSSPPWRVGVPLGRFIGLWLTAFILIASLLVGVVCTHPALLVQR